MSDVKAEARKFYHDAKWVGTLVGDEEDRDRAFDFASAFAASQIAQARADGWREGMREAAKICDDEGDCGEEMCDLGCSECATSIRRRLAEGS